LIEAGNKINWYPRHMKKRYCDWVENLKWDWCISRERFFGIPIPAYSCDDCHQILIPEEDSLPVDPREDMVFEQCPHCGSHSITPETTVFDTWFTSSLTPEINNQHELNGQLRGKMLPMSMRPQAHDIIRTWAVYTILMSLYNYGEVPWKDLMISGHVLVKKGEKISKKTGGGQYKPRDLISQHSADAIRYAMCQASIGKDSYYEDEQARNGRKLVTKLLNAGKFSLANLQDFDPTNVQMPEDQLVATDRWIIQRMREVSSRMVEEFERYEFSRALSEFERFFWDDFTDNYLELIKGRLYDSGDSKARASAQYALYQTYFGILRMASPFVPHITEEMYHSDYIQTGEKIFQGNLESGGDRGYFYQFEKINSIHNTSWVDVASGEQNEKIMTGAQLMLNVVSEVRKFKSERKMKLSSSLETVVIRCDTPEKKEAVEAFVVDITSVSRAQQVVITSSDDEKNYQEDVEIKI
ncbi:class I tRNA ligase family protein, partial [Patescibacteria group bacterium]|nr:class I tRNA ligase family protein [Patescibacteria group bacterium]